jgi:hypothetical protein
MITITKSEFDRELLADDCPDSSYLEQEGFENRLAEFQRGEFGFIGVRAVVELPIPYGKGHILQKIESPGLWGIESDSGDDYLDSVFQEEIAILTDMLAELGVKITP